MIQRTEQNATGEHVSAPKEHRGASLSARVWPPSARTHDSVSGRTKDNVDFDCVRTQTERAGGSRGLLGAAPGGLARDWQGWSSPWQQRECRPRRVPAEQLAGCGRLVSEQIYGRSSTACPASEEEEGEGGGGDDKGAVGRSQVGLRAREAEEPSSGALFGARARSSRRRRKQHDAVRLVFFCGSEKKKWGRAWGRVNFN